MHKNGMTSAERLSESYFQAHTNPCCLFAFNSFITLMWLDLNPVI